LPTTALRIALLGGEEPLAQVILQEVAARDLDVAEILPLSLEDSEATLTFKGDELPVLNVSDHDWQSCDVVTVASHASVAGHYAKAALEAGNTVLGPIAQEPDVASRMVAVPSGPAVALCRVLGGLARKAGLAAAHVTLNLPVSHHGQAAIEELSSQTRALFNLESPDPGILPPRIAFNIVPHAVGPEAIGISQYEKRLEEEIRTLLELPSASVMAQACWVPVFYGYSASLHVTTETAVDSASRRRIQGDLEGITIMDEVVPGGLPTPATDAQDSEDVFVGRLRVGDRDGRQLSLWLVFDGLRLEAAQIVDALENLIEKNQNSVLT
jgi:aspartate-semialdehyde dehydrogenase